MGVIWENIDNTNEVYSTVKQIYNKEFNNLLVQQFSLYDDYESKKKEVYKVFVDDKIFVLKKVTIEEKEIYLNHLSKSTPSIYSINK